MTALDNDHECGECGRRFATRRGLGYHRRARHPGSIPAESCSVCGHPEVLAKEMCRTCYTRARTVRGTCSACGKVRMLRGGRRCQRCTQRMSTRPPSTCADCLSWGPLVGRLCSACHQFRRKGTLGVCPDCRREVPLGQGGRCRLCAITRHASGSREGVCVDCGCWTRLVTRRCNSCQVFLSRGRVGRCSLCGNEVVIGRLGRCRGCLVGAARSGVRYPGRPIGQPGSLITEAPASGGIQLFFGGMREAGSWSSEPAVSGDKPGESSSGPRREERLLGQLRLIWVPADLARLPLDEALAAATDQHPEVLSSVTVFGKARGWPEETLREVQRAVSALLAARSGEREIPAWALEGLHRRGLPLERTVEFLDDAGLRVVDPEAVLEAWVEARVRHLPDRIRSEVVSWIEVLRGRSARRVSPVQARTVKVYLVACLPTLGRWARRYESLRQVTEEDIERELVGLRGWAAVNALTALRSLFRTLKANRLVFTDPAARVRVLAPPKGLPLSIDPSIRQLLLRHVERPDHRLIVLLAGVHALSRRQIADLLLEHLDLAANRFVMNGRPRPLDALTREHLDAWLTFRRARWPRTANPHVLVSVQSANNLRPVGLTFLAGAFERLPVTPFKLKVDRLVSEALASRGDGLRISLLFGVSLETAGRYAATLTELEGIACSPDSTDTTCG